jgi:hypothetical protein
MLSVNGSPLANPLKAGLDLTGWLSRVVETGKLDSELPAGHCRTNSIVVRTATTTAQQANSDAAPSHSRTNSASTRPNQGFVPTRGGASSSSSRSQDPPASQPSPPPSPTSPSPSPALAALVAVPTADGHLLEFDPFQTSPGEIDALEDISADAKKQAKEDMRRLVLQAMERWKVT